MVSSTVNRLRRFVGNDTLRMMFGQGDGRPSFDFAKAVAEGWIVLVCLATEGSNVSREHSDLVGSLMLSDLWTSAADRGKRDRQRQYLVVADEFQRYLNPSIAEGLDQSRGFGLAWLLSCQYPRQMLFNGGEKGEHLLASLMENVGCKLTFQLTDEPNLGPLASWLFRGVFDPNGVKFDLYATRVVDYVEEVRESVTRRESTTETQSSSTTTQRSTSESSSENWLPDPEADDYNVGEYGPGTRGTSTTSIEGETNGTSTGETRGKSVSQQHMLRPILGTELAGRQFSGLDEHLFEATQMIFRLPPRMALARSGDMPGPLTIRIPTIESGAGRHYAQRFARRSGAQFPFIIPATDASKLLEWRQTDLRARLNNASRGGGTDDPPTAGRLVPKKPKKP